MMDDEQHQPAHDAPASPEPEDNVAITLTHHNTPRTLTLPQSATITDLSAAVEAELSIPASNQKFLVPKLGLLKLPFKNPELPVADLQNKKINLMGATVSEVASLASASEAAAKRTASLAAARRNQPKAATTSRARQEDSTYTFLTIRPLPNLPNPERSRAFLERLKADPGIIAAMRKHKFSVGLLTEMDPLTYTEEHGDGGTTRILGLNRNHGEVIELRLRTDAYDGYRDYRTIRNTLCHELAHNVHGPHDRDFWDLCHQIEREVARADWKSGGRSVGDAEYYEPVESEEIAYDHGGWTGGEFVLGGSGNGGSRASASTGGSMGTPLSRREIMARAAEERLKRMRDQRDKQQGQGGAGSS